MADLPLVDFSGGLNQSTDPERIAPNELSDVLNMRIDENGILSSRKGLLASLTTGISSTITSTFEGIQLDDTTRVVLTAEDKFYYESGSTAIELTKAGSLNITTGARYRWVLFNDLFIGVNRSGDQAVKWDGNPSNSVLALGVTGGPSSPTDVAAWNRRLCMIDGDTLYVSEPGLPENWNTGDAVSKIFRGARHGQEKLKALYVWNDLLIVWGSSFIWEIDPGDGVSTSWQIRQISNEIGCDAFLSIIDTGRDLIFATKEGLNSYSEIRSLQGKAASGNLSKKIKPLWDSLTLSDIDNFTATYDSEYDAYYISSPSDGKVIELNLGATIQNQTPSFWKHQYAQSISYYYRKNSVNSPSKIFGATTTGRTYNINRGDKDDSSTFRRLARTRRNTLGSFKDNKYVERVDLDLYQNKSFNVTLNIYTNFGRRVKSKTYNALSNAPLWDVAQWDVDSWGASENELFHYNLVRLTRNIEFEFVDDGSDGEFKINKLNVSVESMDDDKQASVVN